MAKRTWQWAASTWLVTMAWSAGLSGGAQAAVKARAPVAAATAPTSSAGTSPGGGASGQGGCIEAGTQALDRASEQASHQHLGDAAGDPMQQLQGLVREANRRSAEVGAARLLADATEFDLSELQASRKPRVTLFGSAAYGLTQQTGRPDATGVQGNVGLNVSAPLFDGGRLDALDTWRKRLSEAARQGQGATSERVALEAVYTALERHRYRLQAQIYQQYARKMGCLVEALDIIVSEDKGRASELVQARKSRRQAEIQREQAMATARQFETRLRKLVGEQVQLGEGFSTVLMSTPALDEVQRLIERSAELQRLQSEADAQQAYAQAVATGNTPQVNWTMGESVSKLPGSRTSSLSLGVQFSWQLYDGGGVDAATRAALKRAEAYRQNRQEALQARMSQVAQQHDTAVSAFDRARRHAEVMRDSDRVRNFTFQQWSQLGRRSLFDVMSAESDHFNQRVSYINALVDGAQANASLRSQGLGLIQWVGP